LSLTILQAQLAIITQSSIMQFFLLGEPESTSRNIDVDTNGSLYDLQSLIAAHFAIVEPQGRSLSRESLTTLRAIH
jgi:hypothetical protein